MAIALSAIMALMPLTMAHAITHADCMSEAAASLTRCQNWQIAIEVACVAAVEVGVSACVAGSAGLFTPACFALQVVGYAGCTANFGSQMNACDATYRQWTLGCPPEAGA